MSRLLVIGALGVFVVGSIILMATAPNLYLLADRSMRAERAAVADLCAAEIRAAGGGNPAPAPAPHHAAPSIRASCRGSERRRSFGNSVGVESPERNAASGNAYGDR